MALIQRIYEPQSGSILIDNIPAYNINLNDYRKNIAIVPQDIKIFNGTIAENILLGRPINSFDELILILKRYGFMKFLNRFGNGIYSLIGEENRQLSGGETQLLGLARALFNNPAILMIDEGLNALDLEVENLVLSILSAYAEEHAVLISTHNLRIMQRTNYLYVLDKGKIIQKGRPSSLLKKSGFYRSVYGNSLDFLHRGNIKDRSRFHSISPITQSQSKALKIQ
jgi:ABC-type multidrug transport system fused ATPase/permease subunit